MPVYKNKFYGSREDYRNEKESNPNLLFGGSEDIYEQEIAPTIKTNNTGMLTQQNDPVNIVSDNTPDVEVLIDEDVGDVSVVQETPQYGGYKPTSTTSNVPTEPPTDSGLFTTASTTDTAPDYTTLTWQDLEQQRLEGSPFTVPQDFVTQDQALREQNREIYGTSFGVGEDISGYDFEYVGGSFDEQKSMSAEGQLSAFLDSGTAQRLRAIGLEPEYKQDAFKGYRYNPQTGVYDYYDNTPSNFEQLAPALIQMAVIGVATAGFGNAIAGSQALSGFSYGAQQAIGYGTASGAVSAAQGGDANDIITSAILGGLGGYSRGLDNIVTDAEYLMGLSEADRAAVIAQAQMVSNIKDATVVANALSEGDPLRAIAGSMSLLDLDTPVDYVNNYLSDTFGNTEFLTANGEAISKAIVKVTDKVLEGQSLEDAITRGIGEYIQEGGTLEGLGVDGENTLFNIISDGFNAFNENILEPIGNGLSTLATATGDVLEGVAQFTGDVVGGIGDIASTVGSGVGDVVEDFTQFLGDAGEDVVNFVSDNADLIGNFLLDMGSDIGTFLQENGEAFGNFIAENGEGFVNFLTENGEAFASFLEQSGESIGTFITDNAKAFGTFLEDNGKAFGDFLTTNGEAFATFLTENGTAFADFITEGGESIVNFIKENGEAFGTFLTENATAFNQWLSDSGTTLGDWLSSTGESITTWLSDGGEALGTFITENGEAFLEFLGDAGTDLATFIKDGAEGIATFLTDNGKAFGSFITENGEALLDFITEQGEGIGTWLSDNAEGFATFISENATAIGDWLSEAGTSISDFITTNGEDFATWLSDGATSIADFLEEQGGELLGFIEETGISIGEFIETGLSDIATFVSSAGEDVLAFLEDAGTSIWDFMAGAGEDVWAFIQGAGEDISNFISDSYAFIRDDLVNPLLDLGGEALDAIEDMLSSGAESFGDFIDGAGDIFRDMISGFEDIGGYLFDQLRNINLMGALSTLIDTLSGAERDRAERLMQRVENDIDFSYDAELVEWEDLVTNELLTGTV